MHENTQTGLKEQQQLHAHRNIVKAAVNPLTSTVLVLIKTRCRENDCREERSTGSDTCMHTHMHTNSIPGETAFRIHQPLAVTSGELTHAETKTVNDKLKCSF